MKNIGLNFFSIVALEEPTLSKDFRWVQNPHTPSHPPKCVMLKFQMSPITFTLFLVISINEIYKLVKFEKNQIIARYAGLPN